MTVESDIRFDEAAALVISGVDDGLEAAAEKEKQNVEARHDEGADATGAPWEELAPETVKRKGHSKVLYESGNLRNSYYTRRLGALSVALGNSDGKASLHENGTEDIPPRPMLGPARTHLEHEVIEDELTDAIQTRLAMLKFRQMF